MTKRAKILRNIGVALAAFIVLVVIAAIVVVRTDWFRNYVKEKIITATEEGTGGKVEIGSFSFEWSHLRAIVTDFVIHGTEPASSAPFVRARRVEVDWHLFTKLRRILEVRYLGVDQPEANIIVFADGRNNMPTPKKKSTSKTTPLETVVDLAVGHFELSNGSVTFNSQKQPLDVRGNNLRVQLWYNMLQQGYQGQLSLEPLYVVSGRNTPVRFTVNLPVVLQRDRIDFRNAKIYTAASEIIINGSLEDMRNPKSSAHINGHVALADLKNAADLPLALKARDVPSTLDLDANASVSDNAIQVTGLRLGIGHSNIEASGTLKDASGRGSLQFKVQLALGELGRLAKLQIRPDGTLALNGTAKLDANNNYDIRGNLAAKNVSFQPSGQRIQDVNLFSAVHFDPHHLDLNGLRLRAFGGEFDGNLALEDFTRYKLNGDLRRLDLKTAMRSLGQKALPYDGVASGKIDAAGDLKAPGTKSVMAQARLSIAPGRQGIPVSGRLNADYNGATDNVSISNSYIALPHTRLTVEGSLGKRLNLALTMRDLNDLFAAVPMQGQPPVTLNGGQASLNAVVTGSLTSPHISAHLAANAFKLEGRRFDSLAVDAAASSSRAAISNGSLTRGPMQAQFAAAVGLRNWKATPNQPLSADASITNGDLADILAMAGRPSTDYSGALSANAHVTGTIGNPRGAANLLVANGTIQGESFDRAQAQVNMSDQLVAIPAASITAGHARVNLTAEFQHPRDSFSTGRVHAHLDSNQINLAQFRTLQKQRPNTAGLLQINVDATGDLAQTPTGKTKTATQPQTEFRLASVNADVSARGLRFEGQNYGDLSATARTNGQMVNYNVVSNFAGSNIRINGNTELVHDYPTTADAAIKNLPVERVLAVAKRGDIPAKGNLSTTAHFKGTMQNPEGNVDLALANAVLYDEPINQVRVRMAYLATSIELSQLEIISGPSRIDLTARYEHPAGNLQAGNLQFRVDSSRIDLSRIRNVQKMRPGLGGTLQIAANGSATVHEREPRILFKDMNANLAATGIAAQGVKFGDLTLSAKTAGSRLNFALDSSLASASIQARGNAELGGDYPLDARLTFKDVTWNRVHALLGPGSGEPPAFDAAMDGQATVSGPVMKTADLRGSLEIARLQVHTIPEPGLQAKPIVIQNQGPIIASLDRGVARIVSLHLTGPQTDIQAKGTVSLEAKAVDASLNANTNLGLLQQLNHNVVSSGNILVVTTVHGTTAKPVVNGRLELRNASLNYTEAPNGISNANGLVLFNGDSASISNFTAESGGGKINLGGSVVFGETPRFALRADATKVRIRVQQGVSTVASASLNLTGGTQSSLVSGTVTIDQLTYAPQSDFGSMLSRAAPPVQAPAAPSPLLDNMKLDIQVRTSSAMAVQAAMAQNLQVDANLRVRGTASQPSVLGRVNISQGQLVFFGSTYTVNTGTIGFYNPVRIQPVLNLSLETKAKGVEVVLTVTGPIDNMKLTYTSDPPLQFQEIVGLLAAGKTPTSDPTILANQPAQPPQSFEQMGESALLSKAMAAPVANQLQRVFGVSQLSIDPAVVGTSTGGSQLTARMTLQQQVTNDLTFTYITAFNDPNGQIIRIEWALNPQWSAIATRNQYGIFNVNFFYKKQFR